MNPQDRRRHAVDIELSIEQASHWNANPRMLADEFSEWYELIRAREMGSSSHGYRLNICRDDAAVTFEALRTFADALKCWLRDPETPVSMSPSLFDDYADDLWRASEFHEEGVYREETLNELMTRLPTSRLDEIRDALAGVKMWARKCSQESAKPRTQKPDANNHTVELVQRASVKLVTAEELAKHISTHSRKAYGKKGIEKYLRESGCKPSVPRSGRLPNKWNYIAILPDLRKFKTGRAKFVEWPDEWPAKNSNEDSSKKMK